MTVDDFDWAFDGDHDDDKEEDERYSFLVDCTLLCWERISVRNNNKNKQWWFGLVCGIWSSYNFSPEAKNEKKSFVFVFFLEFSSSFIYLLGLL